MRSISLCCSVIIVTSLLPPMRVMLLTKPVYFARTSTSTTSSQSVTSTKSSTSTTYQSFAIDQPGAVVQSFPLTRDGVSCHYRFYGQHGAGKSLAAGSARPPRPLANLSPFDCHVQCPPQTSTIPNKVNFTKSIISTSFGTTCSS